MIASIRYYHLFVIILTISIIERFNGADGFLILNGILNGILGGNVQYAPSQSNLEFAPKQHRYSK